MDEFIESILNHLESLSQKRDYVRLEIGLNLLAAFVRAVRQAEEAEGRIKRYLEDSCQRKQ